MGTLQNKIVGPALGVGGNLHIWVRADNDHGELRALRSILQRRTDINRVTVLQVEIQQNAIRLVLLCKP